MPTDRIFSRDINLQGFRLKNYINNPMTTTAREALTLGVADEGYVVYDTTADSPYYWTGTAWVTWGGGGGGGDVINISYSALQALTGGSTTATYFMTTPYKEGFWRYSGTVADQSTDNEGTVIVTADLKQYKRVYNGTLDIGWFGGVPDYAPSGNTMTGTNNITALNKMWAAAYDNQPMLVPDNGSYYFNGAMTTVDNNKIMNLIIDANTYHLLPDANTGFINVTQSGKENRFVHNGRAFGKLGIPSATKANYDANTGPDWNTFTGILVKIIDGIHGSYTVNYVDGFAEVFRISGGLTSTSGAQENTINFKWLHRNKYGIRFVSVDPTCFCDKNICTGGRISGQFPINFEGNIAGTPKTGAFTANVFNNVLLEAAETGITGTGTIRFNSWIGCQIEGGDSTGIFSDTVLDLGPGAICNSFIGMEYFSTKWMTTPNYVGEHFMASSTNIINDAGVTSGSHILGSVSPGRVTILGTDGLSNTTRNGIAANVDIITLLGISPNSTEARMDEFAKVRVLGVDQAVAYKGKVVNITTGGDTVLVPPTGYVRLAAGSANVSLVMDGTQIKDGSSFILEQVGTGTVDLRRASDNVSFMAAQTLSQGYYFVRYFGAGAFAFVPTKLGGGGLAGFTAVGSTPNANAGSISGTNIQLQPASVSFPGVVTIGTQQFGGDKEVVGNFAVRKTTATTLSLDNTSATESTLTSFDVTNTVGGAYLKVNNNVAFELARKDNTGTAAIYFANGKTYGSGRLWYMGMFNNNNHFILNNNGGAENANAIVVQSSNSNVRIGSVTTDPGVKFQVDGDIRTTQSLYLGSYTSDPTGSNGEMYYNSSTNKFRAYEGGAWVDMIGGGGGGGGGVSSVGAVGAGTANAGSISGSVLTLHAATSTQPGLWTTGTQTLAGIKTFTGTHIFRANSTASGTAPFKLVEGSALMNIRENGSIERFGEDLWFTNNVDRYKLITSHNNAVLVNKTWMGETIDIAYGGNDTWEYQAATAVTGSGGGTGATLDFPNSNRNGQGQISITVGSSPSTSGYVIRVSYGNSPLAPSNGTYVVLTPTSANAAGKASSVYVTRDSSGFSLWVSSPALVAGQTYSWDYMAKRVISVT